MKGKKMQTWTTSGGYHNKFLVTGDCHRDFFRFKYLKYENPKDVNIIILGDAGVNYTGKYDHELKSNIQRMKFNFYLVRGNHEMRPEDVPNMILIYDDKVEGYVYCEPNYPNIRYFQDGGVYYINGRKTLVIGGAYSVDKHYRLATGKHWFENEQLTYQERKEISKTAGGQYFNLILSHTCPERWEPVELFLSMVDQSTVDKTMELWLNTIADKTAYGLWLFGHYHGNMAVRPRVHMLYQDIWDLEELYEKWDTNDVDDIKKSMYYDIKDNLYNEE